MTVNLGQHILDFMNHLMRNSSIELYNEAGLQYELAFYLRSCISSSCRIQLERNISAVTKSRNMLKSEMDIYVENIGSNTKHCVELKVPISGQVPNRIFEAFRDVRFLEQLNEVGFDKCYLLFASNARSYWECSTAEANIYKYFNGADAEFKSLYKTDVPPFLKSNRQADPILALDRIYKARWHDLKEQDGKKWRYFLLEV